MKSPQALRSSDEATSRKRAGLAIRLRALIGLQRTLLPHRIFHVTTDCLRATPTRILTGSLADVSAQEETSRLSPRPDILLTQEASCKSQCLTRVTCGWTFSICREPRMKVPGGY